MFVRRRLSARGRVVLATSLTLAITIALLVAVAYWVTNSSLDAATDRALIREAQAYLAAMRGAPQRSTLPTATRSYLEARASQSAGIDPILLVAFHKPVGTGWRVISNSTIRIEDAARNNELKSPSGSTSFAYVSIGDRTYRLLSVPVYDATGARAGIFQAALAVDAQRSTANLVAVTLTSAGVIAFALGVALSFWTAGRALEPLRRMAVDAASVSHAAPGRRIAYDGPGDELGSLADSVNAMLDRLEAGADEQRRFIADASHELRTPVAIIRGNIELLRTGEGLPSSADESLDMIEQESARMTRLLDDLLGLARLQGPRQRPFQPLHAPTLLAEMAARGRLLGDRVFTATCGTDAWVSGDPDLLEQALLNVVRNAVAHTSDGGHIVLACQAVAGNVRITVTDDGPGIPPAELDRIFDRFYRAQAPRNEQSGGAGLGLAISKALIGVHGGTVSAENVEPTGARFTISLPRVSDPS